VAHALVCTYVLASVGVALEVAFTGQRSLRKRDVTAVGHSYLWMFPIYGLVYPMFTLLWPVVGDLPLVVRGLLYVPAFMAAEYASGWLLRRILGRCPWEDGYRAARWGVHGLVRLDYAPAWFAVALLFERLYLWLPGVA
jgi:uncharacterized membrane protein